MKTYDWLRGPRRKRPYQVTEIDGDAVRVKTARGHSFLIDRADYERLADCRFRFTRGRVRIYRRSGEPLEDLATTILPRPSGQVVDHINGDKSDNRRSNLRICSRSENNFNMAISSRNTSGYKGVTQLKGRAFQAQIKVLGRYKYLGLFSTAEAAAQKYDDAAREKFGRFACVNFPRDGEQAAHRFGGVQ